MILLRSTFMIFDIFLKNIQNYFLKLKMTDLLRQDLSANLRTWFEFFAWRKINTFSTWVFFLHYSLLNKWLYLIKIFLKLIFLDLLIFFKWILFQWQLFFDWSLSLLCLAWMVYVFLSLVCFILLKSPRLKLMIWNITLIKFLCLCLTTHV